MLENKNKIRGLLNPTLHGQELCSGNLGGPPPRGFFFCWFHILRKILETCVVFPWLFLIFREKWNGARVISQTSPWKPMYRKLGYYTTLGYLICNKFCAPYAFTFQWHFKSKMCLAKYDHRNLICEESSYTMTWYEEKVNLKRAWRFLRPNKNPPPFLVILCYVCFAAQIRFCYESDKNGRREVKYSLVRE